MTPELLAAGIVGFVLGAAVVFFDWNRMWNDHNKWLDKFHDELRETWYLIGYRHSQLGIKPCLPKGTGDEQ